GTSKTVPGTDTHTVFLAINKVDRIEKGRVLPQIEEGMKLYPFREIFPISAKDGSNVHELLSALKGSLPVGAPLYPPDQVTDRTVRTMAQEIIREKALLFTHEEVPHAVAVLVEEWRAGKPSPKGKHTYIRATVYVERTSQKGILIGKEGALLKKIGQAARSEIEKLSEEPVFLELWVKVENNWRKNPQFLKSLGYL
ncbi:MAG: GTPase Era, partial [Candidatus Omnitrophica bacterium]|nr:GTPase Era [Candidatus Omnitrophota bacterium]